MKIVELLENASIGTITASNIASLRTHLHGKIVRRDHLVNIAHLYKDGEIPKITFKQHIQNLFKIKPKG